MYELVIDPVFPSEKIDKNKRKLILHDFTNKW